MRYKDIVKSNTCHYMTKYELGYIENLKLSENHKRLYFTLLVLKRASSDGEVEFSSKREMNSKLRKISNCIFTNKGYNKFFIPDMLRDLSDMKLIQVDAFNIKILNNEATPHSLELKIENVKFSGLYYDIYYSSGKVGICVFCEVPFRKKSSNMKYCIECGNLVKNGRVHNK